jgi:hypothetical protein
MVKSIKAKVIISTLAKRKGISIVRKEIFKAMDKAS